MEEIIELEWSQAVVDKIFQKHSVTPEEVEEVVYEDRPYFKRGPGTGKNSRFYVLGRTVAGRYLFIVLGKVRSAVFSAVTARQMDDSEKRLYSRCLR